MYKIVICALLILLPLCVALLIVPISEKDKEAYQELVKSSNAVENSLLTFSEQLRERVIKEIWYQQENSPLYVRIESADSALFFFNQGGVVEVVEQLFEVSCLIQEELFYENEKPMQLVRYLEATQASYNYNTQLFEAKEAKIWRYRIEGHDPILMLKEETPLMAGTAQSVEFTVKGKQFDFHAHRFRATFEETEKLL